MPQTGHKSSKILRDGTLLALAYSRDLLTLGTTQNDASLILEGHLELNILATWIFSHKGMAL